MNIFLGPYLKVPTIPRIKKTNEYQCANRDCSHQYSQPVKYCTQCGEVVVALEKSKTVQEFPPTDLASPKWGDFVCAMTLADGTEVWVGNRKGSPGQFFANWSEAQAIPLGEKMRTQSLDDAETYFREFKAAFKEAYRRELELEYGLVIEHD